MLLNQDLVISMDLIFAVGCFFYVFDERLFYLSALLKLGLVWVLNALPEALL